MLRNKLKFVKRALYKLKRSYGLPIDYYTISSHDVDPETGEKTTVSSITHIRKAIVLRAREFRSFVYDLAYISANKDFTMGGFFDPEDRRIILDPIDMPANFEPNIDDYIVFQNERYTVKEIVQLEDDYAWSLLARKIRGAEVIFAKSSVSVLDLTQTCSGVIVDKLERSVESVLTLTHEYAEVP